MAALTGCLCRIFARVPSRIFAASRFNVQEINKRRRYFQIFSPAFDSEEIFITESCSKQLEKVLGKEEFLRIFVEGGGCSGFQYKFQIDTDTNLEEEDRVFGKEDGRVVIDEESLKLIKGSSVDYQVEMIKAGFIIAKNPHAEKGCSCGASFSVKI